MSLIERIVFATMGLGGMVCGLAALVLMPDVPTATATLSQWLFMAMMLWLMTVGLVFVHVALLAKGR